MLSANATTTKKPPIQLIRNIWFIAYEKAQRPNDDLDVVMLETVRREGERERWKERDASNFGKEWYRKQWIKL